MLSTVRGKFSITSPVSTLRRGAISDPARTAVLFSRRMMPFDSLHGVSSQSPYSSHNIRDDSRDCNSPLHTIHPLVKPVKITTCFSSQILHQCSKCLHSLQHMHSAVHGGQVLASLDMVRHSPQVVCQQTEIRSIKTVRVHVDRVVSHDEGKVLRKVS